MQCHYHCRFANDGKYKQGIADFEKALTLKHTHRNARNYLVQTQVAYGERYSVDQGFYLCVHVLEWLCCCRLEKESRLEEAMQCYREALADDPSQQTARTRLELITNALEKQVGINSLLDWNQIEFFLILLLRAVLHFFFTWCPFCHLGSGPGWAIIVWLFLHGSMAALYVCVNVHIYLLCVCVCVSLSNCNYMCMHCMCVMWGLLFCIACTIIMAVCGSPCACHVHVMS